MEPPLDLESRDDLTQDELRVLTAIENRREELVDLLLRLIEFDTTAREIDDPARDEAALQQFLADRLRSCGAEAELWEPSAEEVAQSPLVPAGLSFAGRPQMLATITGQAEGPSLLLNGHIDVVSAEPVTEWTSPPFRPEVRDGKVFGRGACDMKGGIAAMVFAVETLAKVGLALGGDLLICTVTDEESTGAGGVAAVAHGVAADAGIVTEPSDFHVWIACRGSLIPTISVPGRPGHAGRPAVPWRDGGAVNAIEKAQLIQCALRRFERRWCEKETHQHAVLSPGHIRPTLITGGEWMVSFPSACELVYHIAYLPAQADKDGWGNDVIRDFTRCVEDAADEDDWLAEHRPVITWAPQVPPVEISADEPIVTIARHAGAVVEREGLLSRPLSGTNSWFDGASFTLSGTPTIGFGPGNNRYAHTIDEFIAVDNLVAGAQAIALAALRHCGPAGT